jgi:hypothetical protein
VSIHQDEMSGKKARVKYLIAVDPSLRAVAERLKRE